MPFKSKRQMRYLFATKPKMAKRWAKHTKNIKGLPEKVTKEGKYSLRLDHILNEPWPSVSLARILESKVGY